MCLVSPEYQIVFSNRDVTPRKCFIWKQINVPLIEGAGTAHSRMLRRVGQFTGDLLPLTKVPEEEEAASSAIVAFPSEEEDHPGGEVDARNQFKTNSAVKVSVLELHGGPTGFNTKF